MDDESEDMGRWRSSPSRWRSSPSRWTASSTPAGDPCASARLPTVVGVTGGGSARSVTANRNSTPERWRPDRVDGPGVVREWTQFIRQSSVVFGSHTFHVVADLGS